MSTQRPIKDVHSSFSHNNQKLVMAQIFINWRTGKQILEYPHNGIKFSNEKEEINDSHIMVESQ